MSCCIQGTKPGQGWHRDLIKLGYNDPLPPPIPGVQATLSAINATEIHSFVQSSDLAALNATGEEGEPPLLLTVLDLSQWTRVFEFANTEVSTAMSRLKEMQGLLVEILTNDELDLDTAKKNTTIVEVALRHANNQAEEEGLSLSQICIPEAGTFSHPFLTNLCIDDAHKAALEDLQESILTTQLEKEQDSLVSSGKHLAVPFVPHRTIEDQVLLKDHRVWATGNINSLAPILPSTWRIWAGLSKADLQECKDYALNSKQFINNGHSLTNAFALYGYDHGKCAVPNVKLHVKLDVPTANDRREKHPQEMWNVHRPYLRCTCHPKSNTGCSGSLIWWDHSVWYMINHLEKFFPDDTFPTLKAKFIAFMIWVQGAGRIAVKCQLAFAQSRKWMCIGAIQFAGNPNGKILAELPDLPGPRKIERMLKPASFSVANPGTPSSAPPSKKQKINLNTPPNARPPNAGGYGRGRGSYGRGRGSGYGRGNQNVNKRYNAPTIVSPFQYFPPTPRSERLQVFNSPSAAGSNSATHRATPQTTSVTIQEIQNSPLKARILSFDDE